MSEHEGERSSKCSDIQSKAEKEGHSRPRYLHEQSNRGMEGNLGVCG